MKTTINLNEVQGTYSNALSAHLQEIYAKYELGTSATELKQFILDCTKDAKPTQAKLTFEQNIRMKKTSDDLIMYVSNITLRAEHLGRNINDRWANER